MDPKTKRRIVTENGDTTGEELVLGTLIGNGDDLGPIVRLAFETGRPEALLRQLKSIVRKKEAEIEELCKTHYEEFILAVDELRGVLVDAEELKSDLSGDNYRLQEVGSALLIKLEELLESYAIQNNVTGAVTGAIKDGWFALGAAALKVACLQKGDSLLDKPFFALFNLLLFEHIMLPSDRIEALVRWLIMNF